MLFTVEDDLRLLKELKLTANQLLFVKMLAPDPTFDGADWKKQSYKMALEFQNTTKGLTPNELADLIARDVIIDLNDNGKSFYDYYELSPKFLRYFSLKVYPMPTQLMDAYPTRFKGSDGRFFLGITASAEEIAKDYLRFINNDVEEHGRVLDDIAWGIKNDAIKLGLKKFVLTKYWLVIREVRLKKQNISNDVKII
jgi:hypothetical protein